MISPRLAVWGTSLTGKLVLAIIVLALLALMGRALYSIPYKAGRADVQAKWDESVRKGQAEVDRLKAEAGKVTVRVETKYVDRIVTIREKASVIVREVPVYVPVGSPDLPGGFRLLHNGAASGTVPDPAGIPHAAAVPAQVAASTIAENYGTCLENSQRLTSLQEWVREQAKVK